MRKNINAVASQSAKSKKLFGQFQIDLTKLFNQKVALLLVMASLIFIVSIGNPAAAYSANPENTNGRSLSSALNEDGSLNAEAVKGGSFDARGYQMQLDKNGAPRFRPAATTSNCADNWDPRFSPTGASDTVFAVADDGQGNIYVGGSFKTIGNIQASGIAKFDGNNWTAFGDDSNAANNGVADIGRAGEVDAIAITPAGIYVGGIFTSVRNSAANVIPAKGIALWDGSNWSAITGDDGNTNSATFQVHALALSGNNLYVGGNFDSVRTLTGNTVATNNIAKWDGFNWSALGDSSNVNNNGVAGVVHALAVDGGNLYVGGDFRSANTSASNSVAASGIAKWDGSAWSAFGDGTNANNNGVHLIDESQFFATVYAIAVSGGSIYVGGNFDLVKTGANNSLPAANIAKWDGVAWSVLGDPSANSRNGVHRFNAVADRDVAFVLAITISGGDIYVGGVFTEAANSNQTSVPASSIAKWNGSQWSALGLGLHRQGDDDPFNPLTAAVNGISVSGNNVFAGGLFTEARNSLTDTVASQNLARWNGTRWSTSAGFRAGTNGILGVQTIVTDSGGNIYIGGDFTMVGGVPANHIAKWNGVEWTALGDGSNLDSNGTNDTVFAIAVVGTDVYVGGVFTEVRKDAANAVPASHIAKWDGNNWSALGDGSNAASNGVASGQGGVVSAIAAAGGYIYVGGTFNDAHTSAGNFVMATHIARWNGSAWSALGDNSTRFNGAGGSVYAITASGNGVYVGGTFGIVRNSLTDYAEANNIAYWDGSAWSALGGSATNANGVGGGGDAVLAITVSGSNVYVGGNFGNAQWGPNGAQHIRVSGIVRWDGSSWHPFGADGTNPFETPGTFGGAVFGIVVIGNDIYIGGAFQEISADGVTVPFVQSSNIAKWNGSDWETLGNPATDDSNGLNNYVFAMAAGGGNLYVGGYFSEARNSAVDIVRADHLATWNGSSWSGAVGGSGSTTTADSGGDGVNGTIFTVTADNSGNVYVGGDFTAVGTVPASGVAKWNGSSWSALGDASNVNNNGVSGYVTAIGINGNEVYVGGHFSDVRNSAANRPEAANIAKWNGSSWSALGDGSNLNNNGVRSINMPQTEFVGAIAINNGQIYVGGNFDEVRTSSSNKIRASRIARWNGSSWSALGDASNVNNNGVHFSVDLGGGLEDVAEVRAITFGGNEVYVGGSFTQANANANSSTNASRIAKWDGSNWSALGDGANIDNNGLHGYSANGDSATVYAIAISGNDVYVGGNFSSAKENSAGSINTGSIARWDSGHWFALGDGSNPNGNGVSDPDFAIVFALYVSGGNIYVGGHFTQAKVNATDITQATNIAKWNGNAWSELDGGTNDTVRSIAQTTNSLYVGGGFISAGCHLSSRFGRYAIPASPTANTWNGTTSGDWHTASNWAGGHIPNSGENVVVPDTDVPNEIDISTADVTITNLTLGAQRTLNITNGRMLTVTNNAVIRGNLSGEGTFICGGTTILSGTTAQTVPRGTLSNLSINNPAGVTLLGDVKINSSVNLLNGVIETGANTLTLESSATTTRTNGFVVGNLRKNFNGFVGNLRKKALVEAFVFPVGTNSSGVEYSPVEANITNVNGESGFLTVKAFDDVSPAPISSPKISRYWQLDGSNITADLTFHYLDEDDNNINNPANLRVFRNGQIFCPTDCVDETAFTASVSNVSSFSPWTIAELAPTASNVSISGKIMNSEGQGVFNAQVEMIDANGAIRTARTSSFGYYRFDDVATGGTYVFNVRHKTYQFNSQVVTVLDNLQNVDFIAVSTQNQMLEKPSP